MPALSFSHTRGTAKNQVGLTAGRYSPIRRGSGQVVIVIAVDDREVVVGRALGDVRARQPRDHARAVREADALLDRLHRRHLVACVSWTPFGGPVVPEV